MLRSWPPSQHHSACYLESLAIDLRGSMNLSPLGIAAILLGSLGTACVDAGGSNGTSTGGRSSVAAGGSNTSAGGGGNSNAGASSTVACGGPIY